MIVAFPGGCVYAVIVGAPETGAFKLTADALEFILFVGSGGGICDTDRRDSNVRTWPSAFYVLGLPKLRFPFRLHRGAAS